MFCLAIQVKFDDKFPGYRHNIWYFYYIQHCGFQVLPFYHYLLFTQSFGRLLIVSNLEHYSHSSFIIHHSFLLFLYFDEVSFQ